jgi:hypothetical protein
LAPGVEIVIDLAVMAPVELAVPIAWAHLPTSRSDEAAVVRSVNVVDEVKVMTMLEDALVVGLVSLTVAVVPVTEETRPEAAPNCPENRPRKEPLPPAGLVPAPSPEPPPEPEPPPKPPPEDGPPFAPPREKPAKLPVQLPEVGCEMVTVVAVTGSPNARVPDDEPEVGLPNAEMHEPTVTPEADAETVWSNVVLDVYVTVVWPEVGFCTSNEAPLMAAIDPDAPGICRVVPPAPAPVPVPPAPLLPPLVDGFAVEDVEDAAEDDPQAASVTAATPSADRTNARRKRAERTVRRPEPPHV